MSPNTLARLANIYSDFSISDVDAAYIAGLVDGEGCFRTHRADAGKLLQESGVLNFLQVTLFISNTHYETLERIREITGNGRIDVVTVTGNRKPAGRWYLNQNQVGMIVPQLIPYMRIKRDQAEKVIQFIELAEKHSDPLIAWQRESLWSEIKAFNHRGKSDAHEIAASKVGRKPIVVGCLYPGCETKHYGHGYCRKHYRWVYESKSAPTATRLCEWCHNKLSEELRISAKFCSVSCKMKWHRAEGSYTQGAIAAQRGVCSLDGCEGPVHAQNLCRTHYMRAWRHGDVEVNLRPQEFKPCSVEGCAEDGRLKGLCKAHYHEKYYKENAAVINERARVWRKSNKQ